MSNSGACLRICSTQATPAMPLPTTTSDRFGDCGPAAPRLGAMITVGSIDITGVATGPGFVAPEPEPVAPGSLDPGVSNRREVASISAWTSGRHDPQPVPARVASQTDCRLRAPARTASTMRAFDTP